MYSLISFSTVSVRYIQVKKIKLYSTSSLEYGNVDFNDINQNERCWLSSRYPTGPTGTRHSPFIVSCIVCHAFINPIMQTPAFYIITARSVKKLPVLVTHCHTGMGGNCYCCYSSRCECHSHCYYNESSDRIRHRNDVNNRPINIITTRNIP